MRLAIITTIAALLGLVSVTFSIGGCQSRYRYPCQDPQNWGKPQCHNDACKADGSCTDQVLGAVYTPKIFQSESLEDEVVQQDSNNTAPEQNKPETQTQISSNTSQTVTKPEKKINFRGKAMPPPPMAPAEPVTEGEQPLTMDTVVDTSEHNLAAR